MQQAAQRRHEFGVADREFGGGDEDAVGEGEVGIEAEAGAVVLRTDPALGLTGRHATSEVLRKAGFPFRYPTLDEALTDLLPH